MGTAAALPELENYSPSAEAFNFKSGSGGIFAFILQSRKPSYSRAGAGAQLLLQGAVSSCHCHMSGTSPFLWNSWRWSAYFLAQKAAQSRPTLSLQAVL